MAVSRFGLNDAEITASPGADELEFPESKSDRQRLPVVTRDRNSGIRCRQIGRDDLPMIADLLHLGFPSKSTARLMAALERLAARPAPEGYPQFGYMLEAGQEAVGVLLTLFAVIFDSGRRFVRCNVACWYVLPRFRLYAPLLLRRAGERSEITHINISPAAITLQTIEAQGFRRFCSGSFAAVPAFQFGARNVKIGGVPKTGTESEGLAAFELNILRDHESYGCVSLVCRSGDGSYPFVFRRRTFRRFPVPGAQLLYCRELADLPKFGGAIGRYLARKGMPWILVGTDGPIAGLAGKYFPDKLPMYFKGPDKPRPGELIYTEAALFDF